MNGESCADPGVIVSEERIDDFFAGVRVIVIIGRTSGAEFLEGEGVFGDDFCA
jgi:hypothetical protein